MKWKQYANIQQKNYKNVHSLFAIGFGFLVPTYSTYFYWRCLGAPISVHWAVLLGIVL